MEGVELFEALLSLEGENDDSTLNNLDGSEENPRITALKGRGSQGHIRSSDDHDYSVRFDEETRVRCPRRSV